MEFLYIDSPREIDWDIARENNLVSDLCIALRGLKGNLDLERIMRGFDEDVVHCGLNFYSPGAFQKISLAAVNWFFLRPGFSIPSNSWMASFHVLILKKGLLTNVDVERDYRNNHVSAADIAFQVIRRGGIVTHEPSLLSAAGVWAPQDLQVHFEDLQRFVLRFFDKRAAITAFPLHFFSTLFYKRVKRVPAGPMNGVRILEQDRKTSIGSYAAVIPTINRYPYLKKAIYSLLQNPRPPAEVIVVDQTPTESRVPGYYDEFSGTNVKVFFLDTAGQCTSRNHAVRNVTSDWILFFDDDSEAWDDMIESHIHLLEHSAADVSTGVSLAPWKDRSYIKGAISYYHVASVLDTGNCMMRKSLVESVGLFDLAFDKGSGADDNLGKRLFLDGALIVFNPKAIRTHHKAPMGGLREHGAWWKNKGTYLGPFPLPTESYDFLRFYPSSYYIRLCLYRLVTSYRRSGFWMNFINTVFFPVKVFVSYRRGRLLMAKGLK